MCTIQEAMLAFPSYSACECGRVYGKNKKIPLLPFLAGERRYQYLYFCPSEGKRQQSARVHRHVYEAFHGVIPDNFDVHHKDGNRQNNKPSNLEAIPHKLNVLLRERKRGASSYGRGITKRENGKYRVVLSYSNKKVLDKTVDTLSHAKQLQSEAFNKLLAKLHQRDARYGVE